MPKKYDKTTLTLSIPHAVKAFLDELVEDGYNRSALTLKLISQMKTIYEKHPGIALPKAFDGFVRLAGREDIEDIIAQYTMPDEVSQKNADPWNTANKGRKGPPHQKKAPFSGLTRVKGNKQRD